VAVVAEGHPELTKERKHYADYDVASLYTRDEAEEHGDADLAGKQHPWRHLTQRELDGLVTEPKHCIKLAGGLNDPKAMVFPTGTEGQHEKSPAEKARERMAHARSQLR
jgi:hypothetical protein